MKEYRKERFYKIEWKTGKKKKKVQKHVWQREIKKINDIERKGERENRERERECQRERDVHTPPSQSEIKKGKKKWLINRMKKKERKKRTITQEKGNWIKRSNIYNWIDK